LGEEGAFLTGDLEIEFLADFEVEAEGVGGAAPVEEEGVGAGIRAREVEGTGSEVTTLRFLDLGALD
jgi:hypothetical protein